MNRLLKIGLSIAGGLTALAAIAWLGLQIPSKLVSPVIAKHKRLEAFVYQTTYLHPSCVICTSHWGRTRHGSNRRFSGDARRPTLGYGCRCAFNSIIGLATIFAAICK